MAEFVGYTCSGMAGCISLDSQSPAVTIVAGFRLCSSLVHMLVASRMHGKQHLQHLARVGRILSTISLRLRQIYICCCTEAIVCCVRSWRVVGVSCVRCGKVHMALRVKRSWCA